MSDHTNRCLLFDDISAATAADRLTTASEVCHDRRHQVDDEPYIIGTEVLVNVDEDQDAREKDPKYDIGPLGDSICRIEVRIKQDQDQKYDSRKKEREYQKVYVHDLL